MIPPTPEQHRRWALGEAHHWLSLRLMRPDDGQALDMQRLFRAAAYIDCAAHAAGIPVKQRVDLGKFAADLCSHVLGDNARITDVTEHDFAKAANHRIEQLAKGHK